jgi:hypothetical protein
MCLQQTQEDIIGVIGIYGWVYCFFLSKDFIIVADGMILVFTLVDCLLKFL